MMRHLHHSAVRTAFTLIELLIVVGIILIISPAAISLMTAVHTGRDRTLAHLDAVETAQSFTRLWRADVALAQDIAVQPGECVLTQALGQAAPVRISYRWSSTAPLTRQVDAAAPVTLLPAGQCDALQIERLPQGAWELRFVLISRDGLQTWYRPFTAIATPLNMPPPEPPLKPSRG
jgi:prepilin-type N-terminal cleavage/methylation domain-containing protein